MWGFLEALISAALMSVQGVFNTELPKQTRLRVPPARPPLLRPRPA